MAHLIYSDSPGSIESANFLKGVCMDELNKASFLADFFCSELAVEVYKNSVREVNVQDRVVYLINFAESLWKEISQSLEEGDNDYHLGL